MSKRRSEKEIIKTLLSTPEGTFFDEFYLAKSELLWVPPINMIISENKRGFIFYPLPEHQFFNSTQDDYFKLLEALRKANWKEKKDTKGLLFDFMALSDPKIGPKDIEKFVNTWGPLWVCDEHSHKESLPCIWSPITPQSHPVNERKFSGGLRPHFYWGPGICTWKPMENVESFIQAATVVRCIVEIHQCISSDVVPSQTLWDNFRNILNSMNPVGFSHILPEIMPEYIDIQKILLILALNYLIMRYNANHVIIDWSPGKKPSLKIQTGWGFFRAMLVELAGFVIGYQTIYFCDLCGGLIYSDVRKRKPKAGQYKYCSICSSQRWKLSGKSIS